MDSVSTVAVDRIAMCAFEFKPRLQGMYALGQHAPDKTALLGYSTAVQNPTNTDLRRCKRDVEPGFAEIHFCARRQ